MVLGTGNGYPCAMADIFDVVADATRREILQVLHECGSAVGSSVASVARSGGAARSATGEISVSQIVGRLELSQPTVSKHLRVLRDAGLVRVREEGQHRYYSLDTTPLETVEDWLLPLLDVTSTPNGVGAPGAAKADTDERSADVLGGDAREFAGAVGKVIADTSHRVSSAVEKVTARKWRRE